MRDSRGSASDRVLPATRFVAFALVPVLTAAFIILFFQARNTGDNFAWSIRPPMTAVVMGSGYLGGAYYFARMAWRTRWHETGVALPAVSVFATFMLVATVVHWDRFNHDHLAFWLWVALYIAAPPLVLGLWWANRSEDPHILDDTATATAGRILLFGLAGGSAAVSAALLLNPGDWSGWWPWALSPLTARVISGWFALAAIASFLLARENRPSAWRIPLEATFVWASFIGLGALRYRASFDGDIERTIFLIMVLIWLVGFGALYASLLGRAKSPPQ